MFIVGLVECVGMCGVVDCVCWVDEDVFYECFCWLGGGDCDWLEIFYVVVVGWDFFYNFYCWLFFVEFDGVVVC